MTSTSPSNVGGLPPNVLSSASVSFTIELARAAYGHVESFRRRDRNRILDAIKEELIHNPNEETRNKKILRENPLSDWELRVDPFRVFYEVDDIGQRVRVLAVGIKQRSRLIIGGKEIKI